MKSHFKILLVSTLVVLGACKKFLEPNSESEYVPKSVSALKEMLLYEAYPSIYPGSNSNLFCVYSLLDDDISPAAPSAEVLNGDYALPGIKALYTWQPDLNIQLRDATLPFNLWQSYYGKILGANAALDYLDKVEGTAQSKDAVKAEAKTLRAFYYFFLANTYGPPYTGYKERSAVPLKLSAALESSPIKRNSVAQVYDQIINDLSEAEILYEKLPANEQWNQDYRVSLPMVRLLLSRVYLYMEDWQSAAIYAKKVMDDQRFRLLDLNSLPVPTIAAPYYTIHHYNNPEVLWLYGAIADTNALLQMTKGSYNLQRNVFNASLALISSYSSDDLRKNNYLIREQYDANVLRPMAKYAVSPLYAPLAGASAARSLRLAEAYLNYAEASAMLYQTTGDGAARINALKALNTLRFNRIKTDKYSDIAIAEGAGLLTFIREERRRELCFEEHRWFDLRRYGMPSISHEWTLDNNTVETYVLQERDPAYTLPIPQEALELNSALEQNPLSAPRKN